MLLTSEAKYKTKSFTSSEAFVAGREGQLSNYFVEDMKAIVNF
jgi:hypothetical protein